MVWIVLRGFAMGSADVVPGVSGGTVALLTGIYPRLITSISAGSRALGHFVRLDFSGGMKALKRVDWFLPGLADNGCCGSGADAGSSYPGSAARRANQNRRSVPRADRWDDCDCLASASISVGSPRSCCSRRRNRRILAVRPSIGRRRRPRPARLLCFRNVGDLRVHLARRKRLISPVVDRHVSGCVERW